MSAADVSQLPLREKLQIMEVIWEDLRARADRAGISQEQKDLLDARRARVASGEARLLDWDSVKHSIGRA
jgi:putative addiction module component (TIGR02574 family)